VLFSRKDCGVGPGIYTWTDSIVFRTPFACPAKPERMYSLLPVASIWWLKTFRWSRLRRRAALAVLVAGRERDAELSWAVGVGSLANVQALTGSRRERGDRRSPERTGCPVQRAVGRRLQASTSEEGFCAAIGRGGERDLRRSSQVAARLLGPPASAPRWCRCAFRPSRSLKSADRDQAFRVIPIGA